MDCKILKATKTLKALGSPSTSVMTCHRNKALHALSMPTNVQMNTVLVINPLNKFPHASKNNHLV